MKKLFIGFIALFMAHFSLGFPEEDTAIKIATDLCLCGEGNAGFAASSALLEKYACDSQSTRYIRERMALCLVDTKWMEKAAENGDYVIKQSKEPLFIGAGWFQKSEWALAKKDYKEVLEFSTIAISWLKKTAPYGKEWLPYRDAFLCFSHRQKEIAYHYLGDEASAEEEKKIALKLRCSLNGQLQY